MKCFVIAALVAVLAAVAHARPGGSIGYGGVLKVAGFNPDEHLDYMNHARHAAKMAQNLKIERELVFDDQEREARDAHYVPTFFTATKHHEALTHARDSVQRAPVQAQEKPNFFAPLYYTTF